MPRYDAPRTTGAHRATGVLGSAAAAVAAVLLAVLGVLAPAAHSVRTAAPAP
ncbi:hypothetical protein HGA06_19975, partial [Streptomyces somaliensis DSM 40738]|nr:hypothetical protein [Streptomyces somaliensis DSM 40738]